jgi:hypothetical protein
MKRALLNSLEPGRICEVKNPGEEFEVADTFSWIDCPDDVTTHHTYNEETGEFIPFDPLALPGFDENGYKIARMIGYKSIGDQLDMLYKEVTATGTISSTGPWAQHISAIKAAIPKDDPAAVLAWNQAYVEEQMANTTPTSSTP